MTSNLFALYVNIITMIITIMTTGQKVNSYVIIALVKFDVINLFDFRGLKAALFITDRETAN